MFAVFTRSLHFVALMSAAPPDDPRLAAPTETTSVDVKFKGHTPRGELRAKFVYNKPRQREDRLPVVVVLHGAGGLTSEGQSDCTLEDSLVLSQQFRKWSERLADDGYAVLMPSSYTSRGFCDKAAEWEKKEEGRAHRLPKEFDQEPEMVIGRLYDVYDSVRWLCEKKKDLVDCERLGLLGFSQGGTAAMMALHWQINHALMRYKELHGDEIDIDIEKIAELEGEKPPHFQSGIVYYPGCGFDDVLPIPRPGRPVVDVEDKYSPTAPLWILHADKDVLLGHCQDLRRHQAEEVWKQGHCAKSYFLKVFAKTDHGFDKPDCRDGACGEAKRRAVERLVDSLEPLPRRGMLRDITAPPDATPTAEPPSPPSFLDQIYARLQAIDPRLASWFQRLRGLVGKVQEAKREYCGHSAHPEHPV
jgi:dienelactone hydrolase